MIRQEPADLANTVLKIAKNVRKLMPRDRHWRFEHVEQDLEPDESGDESRAEVTPVKRRGRPSGQAGR